MAKTRTQRVLGRVAIGIAAVVLAGLVAFIVWTNIGRMDADAGALAELKDNDAIFLDQREGALVMSPTEGAATRGIVFYPGAKVDPLAYAPTFAQTVADGVTVIIADVPLRFAIFELRPLSDFTRLAPDVTRWAVSGHSLGGVKACQEAAEAGALLLLGSYCATDLSDTGTTVLSLAGSEDGLSTPDKIAGARDLLPADAEMVTIDGANHASFGAYGPQPGDGTGTLSNADIAEIVQDEVPLFWGTGE